MEQFTYLCSTKKHMEQFSVQQLCITTLPEIPEQTFAKHSSLEVFHNNLLFSPNFLTATELQLTVSA